MHSHTFQSRLRAERVRLGLSQSAFAELCGVQKLAQLKYEKGDRVPDVTYLQGAAEAGADIVYLLTGEVGIASRVDLKRLRIAIEAVEEGLSDTHMRLAPAKKAEVIVAAYELIDDESKEAQAREGVVRMLRLVA